MRRVHAGPYSALRQVRGRFSRSLHISLAERRRWSGVVRCAVASSAALVVLVTAASALGAPPGARELPGGFVVTDRGVPSGFDRRSDPLAGRAAAGVVARLGERERERLRARRERWGGAGMRAERARSRAAYRGLGAAEARALFARKFSGLLARPAIERLAKGGPVREFLSDFTARVGGRVAVSSVPLRAPDGSGGKAPIDLSLRRVGGRYVPAVPFVGVRLPAQLADGIEVGSETTTKVTLPDGAPSPSVATVGEGRALQYDEVFEDTDIVVSTGELGAQVLAQLRSAQAPESISLQFTPPAGARLRQAGPGAEIVRGETVIAYVTPPRTVDAQGEEVPSSLKVDGERVVLSIEHRSRDVAYPLAVDPWVAENYGSWYYSENLGALDGYGRRWFWDRPPDWFFLDDPHEYWVPSTWCNGGLGGCYGGSGRGLMMYAYPGGAYPAGTFGEWIYTIPGYNFDNPGGEPTTYIAMFDFQQQGLNCRGDYSDSPQLLNGIFSPTGGNWTALLTHGCGNPNPGGGGGGVGGGVGDESGGDGGGEDPSTESFLFSSALGAGYNGVRPIQEGKIASFAGVLQSGGVRSQWLDAYLGGAIAYLDDPEPPTPDLLTHSISPDQWTQGTETRTVTGSATDPGLGVKYFNLERRGTDGQFAYLGIQAQHPCTATRQARCPRTWQATLGYSTTGLPEGITDYKLRAFDPGYADNNESSQQTWPVKIDRSGPDLEVDGPVRDQAAELGADDSYQLWMQAYDGDENNPRAGVESIEVRVDGLRRDLEEQACPEGNCELGDTWDLDTAAFAPGTHRIEVIATDVANNTTSQQFDVTITPGNEPPDADPSAEDRAADAGLMPIGPQDCAKLVGDKDPPIQTVPGTWAGGIEHTSVYADGRYRVTRCNPLGQLVIDQTNAPIPVPGGSTVALPITEVRPNDSETFRGVVSLYPPSTNSVFQQLWPDVRDDLVSSVIPPTQGASVPATEGGPEADASERRQIACVEDAYQPEPGRPTWAAQSPSYRYRVNQSTLPRLRANARIIDGHETWNRTIDSCNYRKRDTFRAAYAGNTERTGNSQDRENVVVFRNGTRCSRSAVACTMFVFDGSRNITDADVEVNQQYEFYTGTGKPGQSFDLWSVIAHEVGHTLGLAHVGARYQTMYVRYPQEQDGDGTTRWRTLGKGDVRGVRRLY